MLTGGLKADSPLKGRYVQNLYRRKNAWEVRPAFGQRAQHDTTQAFPPSGMLSATGTYGYQEILGVYAIDTDFGHVQVLTLLVSTAYSGSSSLRGTWQTVYALSIFDETTGRRWEEVLHRHTSEFNETANPMPNWRACFETNRDGDFAAWPAAQGPSDIDSPPEIADTQGVFFTEYQDAVLFGSPSLGLWAYLPCDFVEPIAQTVDGIRTKDFASVRGESSRCFRVPVVGGIFSDAFAYLDSAGFPAPIDAVEIAGRVAIAGQREVYFADAGRPGSIIATNILFVPCQGTIAAIGECNGNLLIFSNRGETYLFQLGSGTLAADGQLQKISDSVGCLGPQAKVNTEDLLVWVDEHDVYASQGLFEIKKLGKDLEPLFLEELSNPLTAYYQNTGKTDLSAVQPRSFFTFADRRGVNLAYDSPNGAVLISVPSQGMVLCLQGADWSLWNLESVCQSTITKVGVQQNLRNLHLCAAVGRLFAVGGVETYTPDDKTELDGAPTPINDKCRSIYVLELGHGGALDRSADKREDNRQFAGWFEQVGDATQPTTFLVERPVLLPHAYPYLPATPDFTITETVPVYLFPVYLRPVDGNNPDKLFFQFRFDNAQWQPVFRGATGQINFNLPPERIASSEGWGMGAPVAAVAEVQCYDTGTGLVSQTGDEVRCFFDGANGGLAWTYKPTLNVSPRCLNPLIYLPFRKKSTALNVTAMSLGVSSAGGWIKEGANPEEPAAIWFWHEPYVNNRHDSDDIAQPIDWCFKSDQLAHDKALQVRARGLYLRVVSHGKGTAGIFATWPWGLVNAAVGSDWKDWTSQILDYAGDLSQQDQSGIRARFKDTAGTAAISTRIFNSGSASPPKWGTTTDLTKGNFLVDDEQFDTISISDSVRGEFVSWTLFGHIRDKAERLVLQSAKAVIRAIAGRRRRGR